MFSLWLRCLMTFSVFSSDVAMGHPCHFRHDSYVPVLLAQAEGAEQLRDVHYEVYRFGEADHPGPDLTISALNPTGLRGKEGHILGLPGGIHNVAETHLTEDGIRACKRTFSRLASQESRRLKMISGGPVPLRPHCHRTGVWSGVAQVSDLPGHPLRVPWVNGEFSAGRVMLSRFVLSSIPIHGVALYAWATGPTWPHAKRDNAALLAQVTEHLILGCQGPRFVAGDFNGGPAEHEALQFWESRGWVEIQDLFMAKTGQTPKNTCKGVSRPDRLYISEELAFFFRSSEVRTLFADHDALMAHFHFPDEPRLQRWWPQPSPLPWANLDMQTWMKVDGKTPQHWQFADKTSFYKAFGKAYENHCSDVLQKAGHGPLPTQCRGRGQTLEAEQRMVAQPVLKPSREGELVPAGDFINRQLQRWFTQLRRLQALLHNLRAGSHELTAVDYRSQVWRAILAAKGIDGPFDWWWKMRPIKWQSANATLPGSPPSLHELEQIFGDFQANYRSFESWHLRARRQALKLQYKEHSRKAFQVVKRPSLPALEHLMRTESAEIIAVDPMESMVHLEHDLPVPECGQWFVDETPAIVEKIDEAVYKVETDLLLCPGQDLIVKVFLTHPQEIIDELSSFWAKRWSRHADLDEDTWDRIVRFTQAFVPPNQIELPDITQSSWALVNRRYKSYAARGSDGFDRNDMLNMPVPFQESLVSMLNQVEHDGDWPQQALHGFGIPLPKVQEADQSGQFRPIIILNMLYRSWASLRSKTILHQIHQHIGPTTVGFLPQREAAQVWIYVQAMVEVALVDGTALCGCVTDVEKAFESIPRSPLRRICEHLGIPQRLLRPWFNFLGEFQRHFTHQGEIGRGLKSNSGLPEGDALSVLGMTIVDWIYEHYMLRYMPRCQHRTFVDNYELLSRSMSDVLQGFAVMKTYMSNWSLTLDMAKTYFWAVRPQERDQLRRLGLSVKLQAMDLGGAMTYSHRATAGAQLDRLRALDPAWTALRKAPMDSFVKEQLIYQALWPRALHAIGNTLLSETHVTSLRTKAMKALGYASAGAHPGIRLFLTGRHHMLDPGFFQLERVILDFRRLLRKDGELLRLWHCFMDVYAGRWKSGPFSKILEQCALIHWRVVSPPILQDHDECRFDLMHIAEEDLCSRLVDAWCQKLAAQVSNRSDFGGIRGLQWPASIRETKMSALERSWTAALRCGAFMTRNFQGKFDLTKGRNCDLCGAEDSMRHRCLDCPMHSQVRESHFDILERWDSFPQSMSEHLLVNRNSCFAEVKRALEQIPDLSRSFQVGADDFEEVHFFSDGSCCHPADQQRRLASWALVSASHGCCVAAGPLPGCLQTINRAELFGAWSAIQWAMRFETSMHLCTHSTYVAMGLHSLLDDPYVCPYDTNADLWEEIAACLRGDPRVRIKVIHVPGHADAAGQGTAADDWTAYWNQVADTNAKLAQTHRTREFVSLWQRYEQELLQSRNDVDALRAFHLALARDRHTQLQQPSYAQCEDDEEEPVQHMRESIEVPQWVLALPSDWASTWASGKNAKSFGALFPRQLVDWLAREALRARQVSEIAWVELAAAIFLSELRHPLPDTRSSAWLDAGEIGTGTSYPLTVASRVRFIRSLVRALVRSFDLPIHLCSGIQRVHLYRLSCSFDGACGWNL